MWIYHLHCWGFYYDGIFRVFLSNKPRQKSRKSPSSIIYSNFCNSIPMIGPSEIPTLLIPSHKSMTNLLPKPAQKKQQEKNQTKSQTKQEGKNYVAFSFVWIRFKWFLKRTWMKENDWKEKFLGENVWNLLGK